MDDLDYIGMASRAQAKKEGTPTAENRHHLTVRHGMNGWFIKLYVWKSNVNWAMKIHYKMYLKRRLTWLHKLNSIGVNAKWINKEKETKYLLK